MSTPRYGYTKGGRDYEIPGLLVQYVLFVAVRCGCMFLYCFLCGVGLYIERERAVALCVGLWAAVLAEGGSLDVPRVEEVEGCFVWGC